MRKLFQRLRRRRGTVLKLALLMFVLVNGLAFMHARSMTHFGPPGPRPLRPQEMNLSQKLRTVFFGVTVPRPTNTFTPADKGLAFTTHQLRTRDGVDLEAWHIAQPNSRGLVICFHGYCNSKASLIREARALGEAGYETLLVDFRGGGGSAGNETTIGYREADDVAAAFDYAHKSFAAARVVLYGQSMGSAAILRAIAVNGIKPDAIILECPYDRMLNTVANRFTSMGLPSFPLARMLVFWGSVQEGYWAFSLNPVEYASHVTCPALLIRGCNDPWVRESEAREILDRFQGPRQLVTFDGVGHEGCFPHHEEKWVREVSSFLDGAVSYDRRDKVAGQDGR